MLSVLVTGTVSSCSSDSATEAPYEQGTESQELTVEMDTGNPSQGIFPLKEDGQPRYSAVTLEYPQGKAFVEGYRAIFPQFGEEEYRKEAHFPLVSAQNSCAGLQMKPLDPEASASEARRIKARIEHNSKTGAIVSEADAIQVFNLAIDTVCPEFIDRKL